MTTTIIRSDEEAIEAADKFAASIAGGASDRDRERRLPHDELDQLRRSGLLGITVPREHGGADVRFTTLADVFRTISAGDPSIGQIPQNHFVFVDVLRHDGSEEQRRFFFAELLGGALFGNALSEAHTKQVTELETRLLPHADGGYRLDGRKFYCTGALFADWIPVFALDEDDELVVPYVRRHDPGVEVTDDWSGMGQRTTASGTTTLTDVRVPAERVVPHHLAYERPQIFGAAAQLMHVAVDVGVAEAALRDAVTFVRTTTRPWFESGVDHPYDEPHLISQFGELTVALHTAQAMLHRAAETLDEVAAAGPDIGESAAAAGSLAVAEAKVVATEVALGITNELFAVAGTKSTFAAANLDRHWRNARTHTLHDPVRWKLHHIGNHALNGVHPPSNGLI